MNLLEADAAHCEVVGPLQVAALLLKRGNKDGKESLKLIACCSKTNPVCLPQCESSQSALVKVQPGDINSRNTNFFLLDWMQTGLLGHHRGFSGKEGDKRSHSRGAANGNSVTEKLKWLLVVKGRGG